jgi:hypothetical protein
MMPAYRERDLDLLIRTLPARRRIGTVEGQYTSR